MRKVLDRIAMMISYEAYVRGSMDNICTMVISLQDFPVCFDCIQFILYNYYFINIYPILSIWLIVNNRGN